ncbi:LAQU0S09e03862g1_1 [Lachancea quebecensis]|uniref:LAQU0S09e03862g1_1 n=1 Tax=Lachancea quebecensis TaxID=1654605 RepID=A0A0P1L0H7_9SACH|nr:LAQU0S09e03862g1_1 [Lachancea quebecensis]
MPSEPPAPAACELVRRFQEQELSENADYALLQHSRAHLHNKLMQKKFFLKQLRLLYAQLDKTHNYQELVDALVGHRALLREIFAMERGARRARRAHAPPMIAWHKYGVDVEQYLLAQDDAASRALVHQSGWVFHDV